MGWSTLGEPSHRRIVLWTKSKDGISRFRLKQMAASRFVMAGGLSLRTAIRGQTSAIRPDGSNQLAPGPISSRPGVKRLDPAQAGARVGDLGPSSSQWRLSQQELRHGDIAVESKC